MNLLLKTIILGAAVGLATPVAIPPQQHHDATEFNHNILDHGHINAEVPPPEVDRPLYPKFYECNIIDFCSCVKTGRTDCRDLWDLADECSEESKRRMMGMFPMEYCPWGPGREDRLPQRDLDLPLDEVEPLAEVPPPEVDRPLVPKFYAWFYDCKIIDYCACLKTGQMGCEDVMDLTGKCLEDTKQRIRGMLPYQYCPSPGLVVPHGGDKLIRRDPDPPLDEVELLGLGGATAIDDIPTMVHVGGPDQMVHVGPGHGEVRVPELAVTSRTSKCLKECLTGPADGPDENRERAECVDRCTKEHPCTVKDPGCEYGEILENL